MEYLDEPIFYNTDWDLPPDPYYPGPSHNSSDNIDDHTSPAVYSVHMELQVFCLNYNIDFPSNNKLHIYLYNKQCHPKKQVKLMDVKTGSYQIVNSTRPDINHSRYAFHNAHYLSAIVGLSSVERYTTACLDSGCSMTLVDKALALSLDVPVHSTQPVNVNGLRSHIQCSTYIKVDVFMFSELCGVPSAGKLTIEAHIVPKLCAKLLIGVDMMHPEGFTISFNKESILIAFCQGLTCPVAVHAKPNHVHDCPVYAKKAT